MSIIAAGTTTTTALSSTGNTDGTLQFQVNGTTPSVTLNTLGAIGVGSTPAFGTSGQVLTSAGSTAAPAWATPSAVNLTTGVTGTLPISNGGTGTTSTTFANLATNVTGTLPVANGGTGQTALSAVSVGTSTNLAGGSNGTIPYQSAAGTTQMLAVGTAGQVLQTNGAGAPTWVTPGGGSWIFLSTVTASGSSTVDVVTTFNSTYDMYAIVATGVYFDVATIMGIRFNLGGSYATSGYSYASSGVNSNTGALIDRTTSWNKINMTSISSGYSDYPLSLIAYVSNPWNSGGALKQIWGNVGFSENNGYTCFAQFSGTNWNDFSALTGVRFLAANGSSTITGKFRLYGIKNS